MRAPLVILLLAGCAAQPEPAPLPPTSCEIPIVTISTQDLITAPTMAAIRRTNTEIRNQCRGNP